MHLPYREVSSPVLYNLDPLFRSIRVVSQTITLLLPWSSRGTNNTRCVFPSLISTLYTSVTKPYHTSNGTSYSILTSNLFRFQHVSQNHCHGHHFERRWRGRLLAYGMPSPSRSRSD